MDLMTTQHDLGEGTSPATTLKKEELIDIKYEDHYDLVPSSAIPNEDQVSYVLKLRLILHKHLMWILCIFLVVTSDNIRMLFTLINSSRLFTDMITFILYSYIITITIQEKLR
jgi:hypothetical protein